ncbi:MAG TPA: hypothetical protein EYQ05_02915 [Gammaproteobacteria bacterium]|nr:hypothetical protein [Gammaproteobacteria bacterium]
MAEELDSAVSGATAGATLGTAILPGIGTAVGAILGGLFGGLSGSQARKKKAKIRREKDRLKALQLVSHASDIGRQSRFQAATQRALYGASGVSMRSGSAQAVESDIMVESVRQQEATLAGLPKKHHWWRDSRRHMTLTNPGRHGRGDISSTRVV